MIEDYDVGAVHVTINTRSSEALVSAPYVETQVVYQDRYTAFFSFDRRLRWVIRKVSRRNVRHERFVKRRSGK